MWNHKYHTNLALCFGSGQRSAKIKAALMLELHNDQVSGVSSRKVVTESINMDTNAVIYWNDEVRTANTDYRLELISKHHLSFYHPASIVPLWMAMLICCLVSNHFVPDWNVSIMLGLITKHRQCVLTFMALTSGVFILLVYGHVFSINIYLHENAESVGVS